MSEGASYLHTFQCVSGPLFEEERGNNMLDGGGMHFFIFFSYFTL